jgi:hypothetical protein
VLPGRELGSFGSSAQTSFSWSPQNIQNTLLSLLFPTSRVVRSNQPKYVKPFIDAQVNKEVEIGYFEVFRKKDIKTPYLKKR